MILETLDKVHLAIRICYTAHNDSAFEQKGEFPMPTQEERLSSLEQTVTVLSKGIRDINHNETILLGLVSEQGKDIREMKVSLGALNERLDVFEESVSNHFGSLELRFGSLEHRFGSLELRFGSLELRFGSFEESVSNRFGSLEQGINSRFEEQDKRFEEQDKKLDQVLLLLSTFIPKPE